MPKCEIKNIVGHASVQGLDDYDSGDEREQQIISRAIYSNGPVHSTLACIQLYPANSTASLCAPSHVYSNYSRAPDKNVLTDTLGLFSFVPKGGWFFACDPTLLRKWVFYTFFGWFVLYFQEFYVCKKLRFSRRHCLTVRPKRWPSSLKQDLNNSVQGSNFRSANGTVAQTCGGEHLADDERDRQFEFENPLSLVFVLFCFVFFFTYFSLLMKTEILSHRHRSRPPYSKKLRMLRRL